VENGALYPWNIHPLNRFNIGALNHYYVDGKRHLFVVMTHDGGAYIKAEGADEFEVWKDLEKQATKFIMELEVDIDYR
jgi:hypothetical protein